MERWGKKKNGNELYSLKENKIKKAGIWSFSFLAIFDARIEIAIVNWNDRNFMLGWKEGKKYNRKSWWSAGTQETEVFYDKQLATIQLV